MCGIFGIVSTSLINKREIKYLSKATQQRGKDASGIMLYNYKKKAYFATRSSEPITSLLRKTSTTEINFLMGHSRLITNSSVDNQPIIRNNISVMHNGIIINAEEVWKKIEGEPLQNIDTEVLAGITEDALKDNLSLPSLVKRIIAYTKGTISTGIAIPNEGKLLLFSNNGSLYTGNKNKRIYFASERHTLEKLNCELIEKLNNSYKILDIPKSDIPIFTTNNENRKNVNIVPSLGQLVQEEKLLRYKRHNLKRCTKCILPETMPYISFDHQGVCNYCRNYKKRNKPKPLSEFQEILEPYLRNKKKENCILPFSGGRDSCYGLHLAVKELQIKPITYTYDWGMVTDLGRRNISRMCSQIGVENIIIASDIRKKRRNISRNFTAWLKSPHLGMVSILTAGDKHFFRHVETVKRQTKINLNIWAINPLEVTHFKAGFLGIAPNFAEKNVYNSGISKQLNYQALRFKAMTKSPGYFNSSLLDTLSGEFYRSFLKKKDYFHLFDYWRWDENEINNTLINEYDWELAPDTKTTWRIGDGTAAMYNYIYYTIAGFTEHDTFRSNQIREGDITRKQALELVDDENKPRYPNLKWYTDCINLDFSKVIKRINSIESFY